MRALLLLCSVVLAGCYVCSPSTCADGCCNAEGQCIVQPIFDNECTPQGAPGSACIDCRTVGQRCIQNECRPACGPTNCDGCCAGTTCVPTSGQSTQRCGAFGQTCQVCAASCVSGSCR